MKDQYGQAMDALYREQDQQPNTAPAWAGLQVLSIAAGILVGIHTHDVIAGLLALGAGIVANAAAALLWGLWRLVYLPRRRRDARRILPGPDAAARLRGEARHALPAATEDRPALS